MTLVLPLSLALASVVALDAGFLLQQHAAAGAPALSLRRPLAAARALAGARIWVAGFAVGLAGWGLYLLALAKAPLSLVQGVSAGGIGLLVLVAAALGRVRPSRRDVAGALLATGGLLLLTATLGPSDLARARAVDGVALAVIGAVTVAGALAVALRGGAAACGLAAGALYGLGDVASKALFVALPSHPGALAVASSPWLYATLAAHGGGFVLLQRAFQQGGPVASVAPMTAAMNLLPIAAGITVFADPLPPTPSLVGARILAFTVVAGGATLLAPSRLQTTQAPATGLVAA
jgi:drug/metabolite transporter (DMT)-like permease